jgi:DNA repair exonuclease SbcCD ATPase subunit
MVKNGGISTQLNVILKHSVKEKWTKKRGATEEVFAGDTHEYFINGELTTAGDYKKYIDSLIDEQTFRILTNPQYFTSLKWKDQRELLTRMVGSIEQEAVANTDELVTLVNQLDNSNDDIVSYRKHLSYQIKKIKEQLDKIPVRLEEQNKALPDRLDWDKIEISAGLKRKDISDIDAQILAIRQGNVSDIKRTELRNQISATTDVLNKKFYEAKDKESKAASEKSKAVLDLTIKFNEALGNQKMMEQTIEADKRMIVRCDEAVQDCERELQQLRDNWPNRKFEVDPNASFCPTCGQPLPADVVEEKISTMRKVFNENLEKEKQSLRNKAANVKKEKEDAEAERTSSENKLTADNEQLAKIKEEINTIFANKSKLEKEPVKTAEEILAEDEQYVQLSKQILQLKEELGNISDSDDDKDKLNELEAKKGQYNAELANLQTQLASRIQYDKIIGLIDSINEEQKDLVRQLSELERKEDVARQYEDRQNKILESRVNEHFKITRWKMFRTVVNNGDPFNEPFCECYDINGTAYHDGLNQAARLNIGLDIINAMSRIYNTSAPVIIDQSESTLDILPTTGQQLRLCVSNCDLQIE